MLSNLTNLSNIRLAYVNFDLEQLQTLLAVIDTGSFEDASIDLGITPSAVSQRIKALESRAGAILVIRSRPVLPTEQGLKILGYVRQISMLGSALNSELQSQSGAEAQAEISVAVNADSLATWFGPVLKRLAVRRDLSCEFVRADEHQSAKLLKQGTVSAAVTTQAEAMQGCASQKLGTTRYFAVAAKGLVEQQGTKPGEQLQLADLPVVNFDRDDPLQRDLRERLTGSRRWSPNVPVHYVPDSSQFARAIQAGMGWGMIPEIQLRELSGVRILEHSWFVDVPLYWQRWTVSSKALDALGDMLFEATGIAGLRNH